MLHSLLIDAKATAASLVDQYLARASVAILFVAAFAFATTALGMELAARFGVKNALWMMAAGFCLLGTLAAVVVVLREREAAAVEEAQQADESGIAELGGIASEAASQAAARLPLGLLAPLLTSPSASAAAALRLISRNIPLVILVALVVLLFSLEEEHPPGDSDASTADVPGDRTATRPGGEDLWREAA